jgi:cell wall-associated NlpC family hydrolase
MKNDWWNNYLYIPFQDKGRSEKGSDCYGLVRLIYKNELGIDLPSFDNYESTKKRDQVSKNINDVKDSLFVTPEKPKPFDIIILRFCNLPMHIGIVTKNNFMLHCSKDVGVSHENYTGMRWKNKVLGFARYERNTDICIT